MATCDYCGMQLPEKGNTHYMISKGRIHDGPACMACIKRMSLVIVGLGKA